MSKLWLDDVRPAPDSTWICVKRAPEAFELLKSGTIEEASLDHDLGYKVKPDMIQGPYDFNEPTGTDLAAWMIESGAFPSRKLTVHSWNRPAGMKMFESLVGYVLRHDMDLEVVYQPSPTP